MLKDRSLDELYNIIKQSVYTPVNDIKLHGYYNQFDKNKLSKIEAISLIKVWTRLMYSGTWKPGGTIDNPEMYINKGIQLTDIGIMINHRVPTGNEFVNLINLLSLSNLDEIDFSIQPIIDEIKECITDVIDASPYGFKYIEPEWVSLPYYLRDHHYPNSSDIVRKIADTMKKEFDFIPVDQFNGRNCYTNNWDELLVECIRYSYFIPSSETTFFHRNIFTSNSLYRYAVEHLDRYQAQNYLEKIPAARKVASYLSPLNKMWYRYINDGDPMESITEDSILVGINGLTALTELPLKDTIILACFAVRAGALQYYLECHSRFNLSNVDDILDQLDIMKSPYTPPLPISNEDYLEVINGTKDDQWFQSQDRYDYRIEDFMCSDGMLFTCLQFMIAIGDAYRIYPDFLKDAKDYNFYGEYIHE